MRETYETTVNEPVTIEGIGLHSGKNVRLTINPADSGGIVFTRKDLPNSPRIRATAQNVSSTVRATTLEENGAKIFTVEHLMSALGAMKIDHCLIEIDAEEPPVTDGSAGVVFAALKKVGIRRLETPRQEIVIDKIYRVDDPPTGRFVIALPAENFRVSFTSVNPHPMVGIQYGDFVIDEKTYAEEIAPARTIAYEKEVEALHAAGLGLGGTLENVIVYNDEKWLNELRFADELVRHKILDAIGDLRLAGIVRGHIIAAASGHALNTRLAKMIANDFAAKKQRHNI